MFMIWPKHTMLFLSDILASSSSWSSMIRCVTLQGGFIYLSAFCLLLCAFNPQMAASGLFSILRHPAAMVYFVVWTMSFLRRTYSKEWTSAAYPRDGSRTGCLCLDRCFAFVLGSCKFSTSTLDVLNFWFFFQSHFPALTSSVIQDVDVSASDIMCWQVSGFNWAYHSRNTWLSASNS
jgi:hypothetical protein